MLSPDPVTQAPENGQNHNRYTYAYNNPLKYSDPSGFIAAGSGCAATVASGGSEGGLACAGEIVIGALLGDLFGGDGCDRVCKQRHADLALCNATAACAAEIGNIKEKFRRRRAGDIMYAILNGLSWEIVDRKTVRIGGPLPVPALGNSVISFPAQTTGDTLMIGAPLMPVEVVDDAPTSPSGGSDPGQDSTTSSSPNLGQLVIAQLDTDHSNQNVNNSAFDWLGVPDRCLTEDQCFRKAHANILRCQGIFNVIKKMQCIRQWETYETDCPGKSPDGSCQKSGTDK